MEDIFDSLIYIIIVIVGFIISALGKKKKKSAQKVVPINQTQATQPKQPTQQKERPFLSNLEQLLNEELGITEDKYENTYQEEIPEKEYEPVLDSPVSKLDTTESILDSVPVESKRNNEDAPFSIEYDDNNEIFKSSVKDEEIVDVKESGVLKNFDLEEAIIYSEIINRKEY